MSHRSQGMTHDPRRRVVLVTGTSSGIGRAIARHLAELGHNVFAGSLTAETDDPIPLAETHPVDVRDADRVRAFVDAAVTATGRVDVLVNNAGFAMGGALEETTMDEAKAQFETNFFGAARMVNAVLPVMRRRGSGQIINIGSGAGITAEPFAGYYSATKFALEGYTEALRHEVARFGIRVSIIEPGWFKTEIVRNATRAASPLAAYDEARASVFSTVTQYCDEGADPVSVARCAARLLSLARPGLRYPVGDDVTWSARFRRLLPERFYQSLVARYYRLHRLEG